jgi:hypothetical protein
LHMQWPLTSQLSHMAVSLKESNFCFGSNALPLAT